MKKTLLASASIAVLLTAANALAQDYEGSVNLEQQTNVSGDVNFKNADITVNYDGNDQATNSRLGLIGSSDPEAPSTLAFSGENTITNKVTLEGNYKAVADKNASLAVDGYLTITDDGGKKDLSAVDLTIKNENNETIKNEGELVTAGNVLTVGNTTFDKKTSIYTFGGAADINLAAGKKITFVEENKIYGTGALGIKGASGSQVDVNGTVDVAVDTSIDGANINIKNVAENAPARMELAADKTLTISNSKVDMTGAPDGKFNGIGNQDGDGKVVLGENTTVNITDGAGIAVTDLTIGNGAVVNASGQMAVSNPATPKWSAGSILQGLTKVDVAEGATVNIADGAQIVTGYPGGKINVDGTVNMSGENALIRASSSQDGLSSSALNVSGVINVLKNSVGIIASRLTEVATGGIVNVANGSTLNLIQDMNRGANSDEAPTGGNAKFNVAGALVNNGIINAEKTDTEIKGSALAAAGEDSKYAGQTAGGAYISNNGTLNGDLTLTGVNLPAKGDSADKLAAILKAAPKAEFSGNNLIKGNVANTKGLITVNKGASLTVENGNNVNALTNNGIIDLAGVLNAAVDGAGNIAVQDAAAHLTSFAGNSLEINADTSASKLVDAESTATQIYVSNGAELNLDNANLQTNDLVTYGTTKLGVDYSSTKTKVGNGGTLDLGSHKLTGNTNLWGGSTLAFNVDISKTDSVEQSGGVINGNIITHFKDGETATINPVVGLDAGTGIYKFVEDISNNGAAGDLNLSGNNVIYNVAFAADDKTSLDIIKKTSSEVTQGVINAGGNVNNANTVNAWVGGNSDAAALTGSSKEMAEHLNTLAQTSPEMLVAATTALAPDTAPAVQSVSTETANQIFGAVGTRLSGGSVSAVSEGKSAGDNIFERAAVWVQGLVNKSKLSKHDSSFDADSQGVAFGAEKYINDDVKVGVGYAYTNTDVDAFMRSTDIDTHSAILYGEYKPSNWYVNGIASYGWSDYEETKNVAGAFVKGKYDVDTIGLQAMTGYEFTNNNYKFTPEAGLRYVNIHQDSYTDSAGQRIKTDSSDILTGVIGAKAETNVALANGTILKPEARLAMTYDLMNDDSSSIVTLANGSAYQVNGKALDRFGVELGAGITADVNDDVELSIGYEGKFRQDYQDHTGLLNAKYKF